MAKKTAQKERIVNCFLDLPKGDLEFLGGDVSRVIECLAIASRKKFEEEN